MCFPNFAPMQPEGVKLIDTVCLNCFDKRVFAKLRTTRTTSDDFIKNKRADFSSVELSGSGVSYDANTLQKRAL